MNMADQGESATMPPAIRPSENIEGMRAAGRAVHALLDFIAPWIGPGISTDRLDRLCHAYIVEVLQALPAYRGFAPAGHTPFPHSIFASVNHQVCRGMPGFRALENGDMLNIDVSILKDGYHASASRMFHVGGAPLHGLRLSEAALACLHRAITKVRPGSVLEDIGAAIQEHAESLGYRVVRAFCGHGIGKNLQEAPYVPNFRMPQDVPELQPGMTLTIAPMLLSGGPELCKLDDGWTVIARDCRLTAHWKDTVLVTPSGCEILTRTEQAQAARSTV